MKKTKAIKAIRTNEEIRKLLLDYLYQVHKTPTSLKQVAQGILQVRKAMKVNYGLSRQEVIHNLDFLIQSGWVAVEETGGYYTTPYGRRVKSGSQKFKISDEGIRHLEEPKTLFSRVDGGGKINITNIQGVTQVGDGNVVNTSFAGLSSALEVLMGAVSASSGLTDRQKLEALAEVATIRSQLAKTSPDKTIVSRAWKALDGLATVANIAQALSTAGTFITSWLASG